MKKDNKEKIRNITLDILELILSIGTASIDAIVNHHEFYKRDYNQKFLTDDMRMWIASLKQRGYLEYETIEKAKIGVQKFVKVTGKGKLKIMERLADKLEKDNQYRFVCFDVPEEYRTNRDKFRRAIKKLGFRQVQKSLWVTNKNVSEVIELAAYEYKVEKYVAYIISQKSDIDGYLDKMFKKDIKPKEIPIKTKK